MGQMAKYSIQIQINFIWREQKIKSGAAKCNAIITLPRSAQSWKPLKIYQ